ncbi:MAG: hypothetical protein JXB46_02890 [Candidatus Eisenbacteria bacterium]|nr:hypothetical protein [Candidatus Eisenbacteria bacterium]
MKKKTATAAEAYEHLTIIIDMQIEQLRDLLDKHDDDATKKDYGDVGDLEHIKEILTEATNFLSGNES